jgi:hypothetical protein
MNNNNNNKKKKDEGNDDFTSATFSKVLSYQNNNAFTQL